MNLYFNSVYKLIDLFSRTLPFPRKGWKYFRKWLRRTHLDEKTYTKKISQGLLIRVRPQDHIQQQIFWYGYYDKPLVNLFKSLIRKDAVVIDAGANIGYFSIIAAKLASSGNVIAIEPSSGVFQELESNIKINHLRNIRTIQAALSDKNSTAVLYLSTFENTGMSALRPPENYSGLSEQVKIIRLDDWFSLSKLERIDVIKIDVEGNELSALKGMKEMLTRYKPVLIVEINPPTLASFNIAPADVIHFLSELGYTQSKILPDGKLQQTNDIPQVAENIVFLHH